MTFCLNEIYNIIFRTRQNDQYNDVNAPHCSNPTQDIYEHRRFLPSLYSSGALWAHATGGPLPSFHFLVVIFCYAPLFHAEKNTTIVTILSSSGYKRRKWYITDYLFRISLRIIDHNFRSTMAYSFFYHQSECSSCWTLSAVVNKRNICLSMCLHCVTPYSSSSLVHIIWPHLPQFGRILSKLLDYRLCMCKL